jgi:hypothetical protein
MRIVHEITVPTQGTVALHPYANLPGLCGYNGIRVEVLIVNSPSANFRDDAKLVEPIEHEVIEIEGPLEIVLDAFRKVVRQLELSKESTYERMGPKRGLDCPNCAPPTIQKPDEANASHTWECQAKWSEVARKQVESDSALRDLQRWNREEAIQKLENLHWACGGSGCTECEWTGKELTTS